MISDDVLTSLASNMEVQFRKIIGPKLPWLSGDTSFHSLFKILYMQLRSLEFHGYADIKRSFTGLTFCRMVGVTIPLKYRDVFDQSPIPSLCGLDAQISRATGERKLMLQALRVEYALFWKSYGFTESVDASGNLVFEFSVDDAWYNELNVLRHFTWNEAILVTPKEVECPEEVIEFPEMLEEVAEFPKMFEDIAEWAMPYDAPNEDTFYSLI